MDGWAVGGRQLIPIGLLLRELHPSPRDLNQISSVLLVEMFRHVETLGRTIKVEVAFRFHVSPSGTCGLNLKLEFGSTNTEASQVQRFKDEWPRRLARPSLDRSIDNPSTLPLDMKFSAELRKPSAQGPPQSGVAEPGGAALRA
jgi:hypothetical protein